MRCTFGIPFGIVLGITFGIAIGIVIVFGIALGPVLGIVLGSLSLSSSSFSNFVLPRETSFWRQSISALIYSLNQLNGERAYGNTSPVCGCMRGYVALLPCNENNSRLLTGPPGIMSSSRGLFLSSVRRKVTSTTYENGLV